MRVIPAIDIIDGKCVRLTQGDYGMCRVYSESPIEVAKAFEAAGIKRLHLVDLDGAKAAGVVNIRVLEEICTKTSLSVDFGGGIKSDEDLRRVFEAGADFVCVGSIAQSDPEKTGLWLEKYGGERIIIGADVRDFKVCIQGWKKITGTTIFDLIGQYAGKIRHLMCTDVSKDGTLSGPATELYRRISAFAPEVHLIASGGVGSRKDLEELAACGVLDVVVGKAIYERKVSLEDIVDHFNL